MGMFDGIESAEVYERGVYFTPGFDGVVEVEKTLANTSRKGEDAFIVEVRVVSGGNEEHPDGAKRSWYVKYNDSFLGNVLAWCAACAGFCAHEKEEIEKMVAPKAGGELEKAIKSPDDNYFIGTKLHLTTVQVTKKDGNPFTRHDWTPVEDDS